MLNAAPAQPVLDQYELKKLFKEYEAENENHSFDNCCGSIQPCSQDIKKIAEGIEDLCHQKPMQYVDRVEKMESAIKDKCAEIKKQKGIVK